MGALFASTLLDYDPSRDIYADHIIASCELPPARFVGHRCIVHAVASPSCTNRSTTTFTYHDQDQDPHKDQNLVHLAAAGCPRKTPAMPQSSHQLARDVDGRSVDDRM